MRRERAGTPSSLVLARRRASVGMDAVPAALALASAAASHARATTCATISCPSFAMLASSVLGGVVFEARIWTLSPATRSSRATTDAVGGGRV